MKPFHLRAALLFGVLSIGAGSAGLWSQATMPTSARPVLVGERLFVERVGAKPGEADLEPVALPPGGYLGRIETLADGWVAGGSQQTGGGTEIFLVRFTAGQLSSVPPPPGVERLRGSAVPLVSGGRLVGLAWLAGERHNRLSVKAAAWEEAGWGDVEEVSPATGGSQVALWGAVLEDGSWLLVWTAVVGQDSETVWSRRFDGRWSLPSRIHEDNSVHDVQPALVAVEGGALVVWSAFDGSDYRLRRARFDGESWQVSGFFGGRGSTDPGFTRHGPEISLLYKAVAPASWAVLQFAADGTVVGFGSVGRSLSEAERPLVSRSDTGTVLLRWPDLGRARDHRESQVHLRAPN